jgi:probable F420-dependent oxidoreductase
VRPLGSIGVWSRELRFGEPAQVREAASQLEELGYSTLWIPGGTSGPLLDRVEDALGATRHVVVATGILNVWMHAAGDVAATQARLDETYPERFLLGLGISHAPLIDSKEGLTYRQPLATMRAYLDALDRRAPPGSRPARVLAALAPRMVALAGERTLGAHPYLVPVAHTAWIRGELPAGAIVAPELTVVPDPDPARARELARRDLSLYLSLPNYVRTWLRHGFVDDDVAAGGSDRLIDALYAHGPMERIAERIGEHLDAGADHVCLRVVYAGEERMPLPEWQALANALLPWSRDRSR